MVGLLAVDRALGLVLNLVVVVLVGWVWQSAAALAPVQPASQLLDPAVAALAGV